MRGWRGLVACPLPCLFCLFLAGCVASPDVKEASSDVRGSLSAMRAAQQELRDRSLDELRETRRLVGRAVVAQAVNRRVQELAAGEGEGDSDLLAITRAMDEERQAYELLVEAVIDARAWRSQEPRAVVERVVRERVADLRASADALEAVGNAESAAELRARAQRLETRGIESLHTGDLDVIVSLTQTMTEVRAGMADLDDNLRFLQLVHNQLHQWIMTDVTASGAEIARLVERHRDLLEQRAEEGE